MGDIGSYDGGKQVRSGIMEEDIWMDGKWKNTSIGDKNALLKKAMCDMMMRNSGNGSYAGMPRIPRYFKKRDM